MPTVATPTFSPVAGTYSSPQTVTISDTDNGLTGFVMYWNTTGSPTSSDTQIAHGGQVTVGTTETLYVIAEATGYTNSNVGSAAYTINYTYPVVAPQSGQVTWFTSTLNWLKQI